MRVRRKRGVRLRRDVGFGGICYVPHRDDFFAATHEVFGVIRTLGMDFVTVSEEERPTFEALAKLGICETCDPEVGEEAYSGTSFLGPFPEIPTVEHPLVVNCFSTSHCPLNCVYCHAYDLMVECRAIESEPHTEKWERDTRNVLSTASSVPAMVAVVTGGEPLFKPDRAIRLIEGLASQKALVLDTSGVGQLDALLPCLVEHQVHVRVSLDSLSSENDEWRPSNSTYRHPSKTVSSRQSALRAIEQCLEAGLGLTVQTVIHSRNDMSDSLADLRDGLIARGVKNWVLHIAVKGGRARGKEMALARSGSTRGSVLPRGEVRRDLWRLIERTVEEGLPIDIRCTDTNSTPNSVLLINSEGDLYTEGYAHNGKVKLYDAKVNRPDRVRSMWSHIDRFGHARRYLNWNPWYYRAEKSLNEICYEVPLPMAMQQARGAGDSLVETEAKYHVTDTEMLGALLGAEGYHLESSMLQRDEYYDTQSRSLAAFDYVLRVRKEGQFCRLAFKGPVVYAPDGEYSRLELEVSVCGESKLHDEMSGMGLHVVWFLEKRRDVYECADSTAIVAIDQIPEVGFFIEVEGSPRGIQSLVRTLLPALGSQETRNYRDIFVEHKLGQGFDGDQIRGAAFG